MKRIRSRLIHNRGKKRVQNIFGNYYYVSQKDQLLPVITLGLFIIVGALLFISGHLFNDGGQAQSSFVVRASEQMPQVVQKIEFIKTEFLPETEYDYFTQLSIWSAQATVEFTPRNRRSEVKFILECLLHRESRHDDAGDHCGDSGKSCGILQFREATWIRMRKQMIKDGVATEIGSLYDDKEAIRTTAWAINNGNAKEWGPIFRDSKDINYASCQTPSWYE